MTYLTDAEHMQKWYAKTFDVDCTLNEVTEHIKYTFKSIQEGFGYHGRIVVKKRFFGYDKDNQVIILHSNKGKNLYYKCVSGRMTISATMPDMSVTN